MFVVYFYVLFITKFNCDIIVDNSDYDNDDYGSSDYDNGDYDNSDDNKSGYDNNDYGNSDCNNSDYDNSDYDNNDRGKFHVICNNPGFMSMFGSSPSCFLLRNLQWQEFETWKRRLSFENKLEPT